MIRTSRLSRRYQIDRPPSVSILKPDYSQYLEKMTSRVSFISLLGSRTKGVPLPFSTWHVDDEFEETPWGFLIVRWRVRTVRLPGPRPIGDSPLVFVTEPDNSVTSKRGRVVSRSSVLVSMDEEGPLFLSIISKGLRDRSDNPLIEEDMFRSNT